MKTTIVLFKPEIVSCVLDFATYARWWTQLTCIRVCRDCRGIII